MDVQDCWSFNLHLLPLLNSWLIAKMQPAVSSLLYRYYFGKCSSELAQLVPLPYSQGRAACYSDRLYDFSVSIPRRYKHAYVNSFFSCTARLWNSLHIERFPLTYDLIGFKSRINCHLSTAGFFLIRFPVCFTVFVLLFLVIPCLVASKWLFSLALSESQF